MLQQNIEGSNPYQLFEPHWYFLLSTWKDICFWPHMLKELSMVTFVPCGDRAVIYPLFCTVFDLGSLAKVWASACFLCVSQHRPALWSQEEQFTTLMKQSVWCMNTTLSSMSFIWTWVAISHLSVPYADHNSNSVYQWPLPECMSVEGLVE